MITDTKTKDEDITELVAAAIDDADGNIVHAADALADRLVKMPRLVELHMHEWARMWAYQKVATALAGRRRSIVRHIDSDGFQNALTAAVESEHGRLMNMPIFGGKRLGDATAIEIRESARRYAESSKDMAVKARWQDSVADALVKISNREDITVRDAIDEAALLRLWEEAGE